MEFKLFETGFKPITKESYLYDIMSALRGPDMVLSGLKDLFTARIRYWVFGDIPFAHIRETERINWELYLDVIRDIIYVTLLDFEDKWTVLQHYIAHVKSALDILWSYAKDEKLAKEIDGLFEVIDAIKDYMEFPDRFNFQYIIVALHRLGVDFTTFDKRSPKVEAYLEMLRDFICYMKKLDRW